MSKGDLTEFVIDLKNLGDDRIIRNYTLDDSFFAAIEGAEIKHGELEAEVTVQKTGAETMLKIRTKGWVEVPCDLCLKGIKETVEAESLLPVRTEEPDDQDEDVVVISKDDEMLDVSWLIYEEIALSVPAKHVHRDGECDPEMAEKLMEYSANKDFAADNKEDTDPRWDVLKKMKEIENQNN